MNGSVTQNKTKTAAELLEELKKSQEAVNTDVGNLETQVGILKDELNKALEALGLDPFLASNRQSPNTGGNIPV